jgi:hypothetical protein
MIITLQRRGEEILRCLSAYMIVENMTPNITRYLFNDLTSATSKIGFKFISKTSPPI